MTPTSQFEILRRRRGVLNASGKFTSAYLTTSGVNAVVGTESAPRGLALGAHATDGEALDVAGANNFVGHLTRRVVVGGASLADRVFGVTSATPVGLEFGFQDGLEVSVEQAEEIEVEGSQYLVLSGTGAIDTNTAVGAKLSFLSGKLRVAQATETVWYVVSANNLTSSDGTSLRIRAIRV